MMAVGNEAPALEVELAATEALEALLALEDDAVLLPVDVVVELRNLPVIEAVELLEPVVNGTLAVELTGGACWPRMYD